MLKLKTDRHATRGMPTKTRHGFTLIEICVATAIIGVSITSLMVAMASGTRMNENGQDISEAGFLAQEVREYTVKQSYNTVTAMAGVRYTPPIDAQGQPINELAGWSQKIAINYVDPATPTNLVQPGPTDMMLVTVTICHNGAGVFSSCWMVSSRVGE